MVERVEGSELTSPVSFLNCLKQSVVVPLETESDFTLVPGCIAFYYRVCQSIRLGPEGLGAAIVKLHTL